MQLTCSSWEYLSYLTLIQTKAGIGSWINMYICMCSLNIWANVHVPNLSFMSCHSHSQLTINSLFNAFSSTLISHCNSVLQFFLYFIVFSRIYSLSSVKSTYKLCMTVVCFSFVERMNLTLEEMPMVIRLHTHTYAHAHTYIYKLIWRGNLTHKLTCCVSCFRHFTFPFAWRRNYFNTAMCGCWLKINFDCLQSAAGNQLLLHILLPIVRFKFKKSGGKVQFVFRNLTNIHMYVHVQAYGIVEPMQEYPPSTKCKSA